MSILFRKMFPYSPEQRVSYLEEAFNCVIVHKQSVEDEKLQTFQNQIREYIYIYYIYSDIRVSGATRVAYILTLIGGLSRSPSPCQNVWSPVRIFISFYYFVSFRKIVYVADGRAKRNSRQASVTNCGWTNKFGATEMLASRCA